MYPQQETKAFIDRLFVLLILQNCHLYVRLVDSSFQRLNVIIKS
jgi:hypothetical protein